MKRLTITLVLLIIINSLITGCFEDDSISEQTRKSEQVSRSNSIIYDELLLFNLVNSYRVENNLAKLTWNSYIAEVCRNHSKNMANGETFLSHDGFNDRLYSINQKITVLEGAENVAFNSGFKNPLQTAFDNWIISPEHYLNIIGDFQYTGVGIAVDNSGAYYFTQIFIK